VADDHDADYSLALPFDTDDPQFRRGVEIGMLWERVQAARHFGATGISATLHPDCAEMVIRIAESAGLGWTCEMTGDDWMTVTLTECEGPTGD
jgi:hypothetical protein